MSGQFEQQSSVIDPLLQEPSLYDVLLINDDYTTMEFVIEILVKFFHKSYEVAQGLMYDIHTKGSAIVATYPRDIAETKVNIVVGYARENNFPLLCNMRPH